MAVTTPASPRLTPPPGVPLRRAPPPVAELLSVDREYRRKARAGLLPRIAPRRFNPTGEPWLPILRTERGKRHYTALFSNTARAHRRGRSRDWVIILYDGLDDHGQETVVTEWRGLLRRRRVVRGREAACHRHYGIPVPEDSYADTDGDGVI
jgi:DNA polymerase (family 10)